MGIQTGEISSRKPGEYVRENYGREQYKKSSIKWAAGAEHISHRFGEKRVLQEVNFQVEEGETFGLLGPSGAGKTTLIRILTGQLKQTSGNVYLLETDTRRLSATQRRQVGIMMDCFGLYDRLSAYRNMAFYADTLPAGGSAEVVLVTEVDESLAESGAPVAVQLKNESKSHTIQLSDET